MTAGGCSLDHSIRMERTVRTDVTDEHAPGGVKPAGGTLRYVERLANPAIMVEYELLLAR